jgi:hypothetical protein
MHVLSSYKPSRDGSYGAAVERNRATQQIAIKQFTILM